MATNDDEEKLQEAKNALLKAQVGAVSGCFSGVNGCCGIWLAFFAFVFVVLMLMAIAGALHL